MDLTEIEKKFNILDKARVTPIYVISDDELRVITSIKNAIPNKKIFIWSVSKGITELENVKVVDEETREPLTALNHILNSNEKAVYILCDIHSFLNQQTELGISVRRRLKEVSMKLRNSFSTIFIIASVLALPPELEKEIFVVDYPLPYRKEIIEIAKKTVKDSLKEVSFTLELETAIAKAGAGLSYNEIQDAICCSLVEKEIIDPCALIACKSGKINKSEVLEYWPWTCNFSEVGGMEDLKKYMGFIVIAFTERARKFGVSAPKGIVLYGVPGTGKSLVAKAVAGYLNCMLVRIEVGRLMSSLVGSSEERTRKMIKIIDALSPGLVLWLDEIDKQFSGINASGSLDSGVTANVLSTILTWQQERKSESFIIATCNNVKNLPGEFLRRGRWNELFFIDLPTVKERISIFMVHLQKRNHDYQKYNLLQLAQKTKGFTGADIEQAVENAMLFALAESSEEMPELKQEHLLRSVVEIVPYADIAREQVNELRRWAKEHRIRPASEPDPDDEMENGGKAES